MRVLAEKAELDTRLFALETFISSAMFTNVDPDEQHRLKLQAVAMNGYVGILKQRVDAFPPVVGVIPSGDNPGPRGRERMVAVTELNPELAGQAIFKDAVPIGAAPIADIDAFAMHVDHWHGRCIEEGNRMLELPEGTEITVEDNAKPGEVIQMNLDGAYLQVFRVGVETVLNIFKNLPFGASIEEAPEFVDGVNQDAAG